MALVSQVLSLLLFFVCSLYRWLVSAASARYKLSVLVSLVNACSFRRWLATSWVLVKSSLASSEACLKKLSFGKLRRWPLVCLFFWLVSLWRTVCIFLWDGDVLWVGGGGGGRPDEALGPVRVYPPVRLAGLFQSRSSVGLFLFCRAAVGLVSLPNRLAVIGTLATYGKFTTVGGGAAGASGCHLA